MSSFWDRRKAAVAAEAEAEQAAARAAEQAATEQALAERSDEELLAEAGQPEPEALTSPEEVRAFLQSALPQRLKTRALRRLWRLNPVLANLDGLLEYGEDYTDTATVVENLQTVYQVGKGMFDKAEALAASEEPAPEPETEEAEEAEPVAEAATELPTETAAAAPGLTPPPTDDAAALPPAPRRMRFRFDDTPTGATTGATG